MAKRKTDKKHISFCPQWTDEYAYEERAAHGAYVHNLLVIYTQNGGPNNNNNEKNNNLAKTIYIFLLFFLAPLTQCTIFVQLCQLKRFPTPVWYIYISYSSIRSNKSINIRKPSPGLLLLSGVCSVCRCLLLSTMSVSSSRRGCRGGWVLHVFPHRGQTWSPGSPGCSQ